MKRIKTLALSATLLSTLSMTAQMKMLNIYNNDGSVTSIEVAKIDSMKITETEMNPVEELIYNMVPVEGGTFYMGAQSTSDTLPNYDSPICVCEMPMHQVTLDSYYINKFEVTQELWEYVILYSGKAADGSQMEPAAENPWFGDGYWGGAFTSRPNARNGLGDNYPAYFVSYNDIVNCFLPRLNAITGMEFRLPTEAEWEYAARGGQKDEYTRTMGASGTYQIYAGSNDFDEVACTQSNSSSMMPVGSLKPNALGLYDMTGNAAEWCSNWYESYTSTAKVNPTGPETGSKRAIKGGGWGHYKDCQRTSYRESDKPGNYSFWLVGFRIAATNLDK